MKDHGGFKFDASFAFERTCLKSIENMLSEGNVFGAQRALAYHNAAEAIQDRIDEAIEYYRKWLSEREAK